MFLYKIRSQLSIMPHKVIKFYTCLICDKRCSKNDFLKMKIKGPRNSNWEEDKCIKAIYNHIKQIKKRDFLFIL